MQTLILTLHIVVCVLLVILILLQSGKEGMGVIFGGGNTSVFGSTGAGGILVKLTTLMAIIFVITSLSYTYVTSSHAPAESSIVDVKIEEPAAPAAESGAKEAATPPPASAPLKESPAQSENKEAPAAPAAESGSKDSPASTASDGAPQKQ